LLVAGAWFVLREKYCWLVADKPSEQGADLAVPLPDLFIYLFILRGTLETSIRYYSMLTI
jgi:hypothetical protein